MKPDETVILDKNKHSESENDVCDSGSQSDSASNSTVAEKSRCCSVKGVKDVLDKQCLYQHLKMT